MRDEIEFGFGVVRWLKVADEAELTWEKRRFVITAVGGLLLFLIGLWQFSITSRNEFAKPVLEKQLELCVEAAGTAAGLAHDVALGRDPWKNPKVADFRALYFGKMALIEDRCVYGAMVRFNNAVLNGAPRVDAANEGSLGIAFACRRMLARGWHAGLVGIYDPHKLFENISDLPHYASAMQQIPGCDGG